MRTSNQIRREHQTEVEVRAMDAAEIVERIHELEDEVEGLQEEAEGREEVITDLVDVLDSMRRTDRHGDALDCWCDSEWGASGGEPENHAQYCAAARSAIASAEEDR